MPEVLQPPAELGVIAVWIIVALLLTIGALFTLLLKSRDRTEALLLHQIKDNVDAVRLSESVRAAMVQMTESMEKTRAVLHRVVARLDNRGGGK